MKFCRLGNSGEVVPVLGMGTHGTGYSDVLSSRRAVEVLRRGVELGLTFIDTAESYGNAELIVGEAIKGRRDKVFLASKVSREHLGYDEVLKACDRSLKRLGVSCLDLYQVHSAKTSVTVEETMRAMERLVELGKTRFIGVSNFSAERCRQAQNALKKTELVSNQVKYNYYHHNEVETLLLPYLRDNHITLIAYSPLENGDALTLGLAEKARVMGLTPAQYALRWLTDQNGVVAIPKTISLEHLEENMGAILPLKEVH